MKHRLETLLVLGAALATGNVLAQPSYPEKPVRLIVNNVPGGGQKFGELWGSPSS